MPFFRQVITIQTRFSPAEVERRLQRIVRKPRTWRELLRRVPENPPQHADFVGSVADGRFRMSRLADVASSVGRFHSRRPACRGVIIPAAGGSAITISFSDPGLSLLAVGMSLVISLVILLNTRGWPLWQMEHAIIVVLVAGALAVCRFSLKQDVEESAALLRACLK